MWLEIGNDRGAFCLSFDPGFVEHVSKLLKILEVDVLKAADLPPWFSGGIVQIDEEEVVSNFDVVLRRIRGR